jgi:hypothetical protein
MPDPTHPTVRKILRYVAAGLALVAGAELARAQSGSLSKGGSMGSQSDGSFGGSLLQRRLLWRELIQRRRVVFGQQRPLQLRFEQPLPGHFPDESVLSDLRQPAGPGPRRSRDHDVRHERAEIRVADLRHERVEQFLGLV